jgi:hypothetical protein
MLTATSFWRLGQKRARLRAAQAILRTNTIPEHVPEIAVDAGGFVAALRYECSYPFSWQAYTAWIAHLPRVSWAALPDHPCEPQLAGNRDAVRARQVATTNASLEFVMFRRHVSWAWVPTIQGRNVDEYVWHARYWRYELLKLPHGDFRDYCQGLEHPSFRVGIGSLCRRQSAADVVRIVSAVADVLEPLGMRFHLWGVKLDAIAALRTAGLSGVIASLDSAAWNGRFGDRINAQRSSGMTQRQYSWQIAWPAYYTKITTALSAPATDARQLQLI